MGSTVWVVVDDHGGDADPSDLPAPDVVVAADGGLALAQALGLDVDVVVGDLDSAAPSAVAAAVRGGAEVQEHPADKDATDLRLALAVAATHAGPGDLVLVVGGSGGRADHSLANQLALQDPELADRRVWGRLGSADLHVVRGERSFTWPRGATVSLLPVAGEATGVRTRGLRWPLDDESLPAGSTRGVSNVVDAERQHVAVRSGCLLAILPRTPRST